MSTSTLAEFASGAHSWRDARRVLCVRLDSMGDVLMTEPALRALANQNQEREISLLTSPAGAEAASLLPWLSQTIIYRAPWMKSTSAGQGVGPDYEMIERLSAGGFDAAVIFTVYSQSALPAALLLHLAGIPLRMAYCRENPYHLLSHWIRETEPEGTLRHEVQRHLDLVAEAGASCTDERLHVEPNPQAQERIDRLLEENLLDAGRGHWLVVHPGASAPSRRYPTASFAAVIRRLALDEGLRIVLTGSESERELTSEIGREAGIDVVDLAGDLDLHELTALLDRAPLLLSNNTGPVHLAAGVRTPVVDLYALTNPQHTPWRVPSKVLYEDVPCRNCYSSICPEGHNACLAGVSPDRVVRAVTELLLETRHSHLTEAMEGRPTLEGATGAP